MILTLLVSFVGSGVCISFCQSFYKYVPLITSEEGGGAMTKDIRHIGVPLAIIIAIFMTFHF